MAPNNSASLRSVPLAPERSSPNPNGVLNVHKPSGWTSHAVVMHLRRVLKIRKIGHGGTLDPSATGVLPVLVGKGTKIAQYVLDWDKEYAAVLRLGQKTDTQDATGTVLQDVSVAALAETQIRSTIAEFQGVIQQVPPMFSAVKVAGQPLYKAARKGLTVERSPRSVTVSCLEVTAIRGAEVHMRIVCSKGTYIRTLCSDIGDQLGVGGHLQWLERRRVGPLHIDQALHLEEVSRDSFFAQCSQAFLDLDTMLQEYPSITVGPEEAEKVMHGHAIPWKAVSPPLTKLDDGIHDNAMVRIKDHLGCLLATGLIQCSHPSATGMQPSISISKVLVEPGRV